MNWGPVTAELMLVWIISMSRLVGAEANEYKNPLLMQDLNPGHRAD
jgi:hypothetical protein